MLHCCIDSVRRLRSAAARLRSTSVTFSWW
jgi:hypothetical protein